MHVIEWVSAGVIPTRYAYNSRDKLVNKATTNPRCGEVAIHIHNIDRKRQFKQQATQGINSCVRLSVDLFVSYGALRAT